MRDRDLYQTILGIVEPWSVTDVDLKSDERKVEVFVNRNYSGRLADRTG